MFAFMPLRRTSFLVLLLHHFSNSQFLIQADFVTQTSREGISEQDIWNSTLRNIIAQCFIQSISKMKDNKALATKLLHFIPYMAERYRNDTFLAPVAEHIMPLAKETALVPTRGGRWVGPIHALIVPDF